NRTNGALEEIVTKLLHLGSSQLHADMFWTAGIRRHKRKIDLINLGAGQGDLSLFSFFLDSLKSVRLLAQIHALLFLELVQNPIHDAANPIIAAQVSIPVGSFYF